MTCGQKRGRSSQFFFGVFSLISAYVAYASGYAAMASCAMLLLFILRRSMFQAMGYTYADLLPLHRGLGLAFTFWSTLHAVCYILYYVHFDAFMSHFNFDGTTRGPQNMFALLGYVSFFFFAFSFRRLDQSRFPLSLRGIWPSPLNPNCLPIIHLSTSHSYLKLFLLLISRQR